MNYTTNGTTSVALQPDLEHSLEVLLIVDLSYHLVYGCYCTGDLRSHTQQIDTQANTQMNTHTRTAHIQQRAKCFPLLLHYHYY